MSNLRSQVSELQLNRDSLQEQVTAKNDKIKELVSKVVICKVVSACRMCPETSPVSLALVRGKAFREFETMREHARFPNSECEERPIGHFRVAVNLIMKASLSAKLFK